MVLFIIAREHCDRGDPVNNKVAHKRGHKLLDCFVSLAMTREEGGVCTVNLITMLRVT